MKRTIALIALLATGFSTAGQPLHEVLKLRTIEVVRCEAVTADNVSRVSRYVREKATADDNHQITDEVVRSVPGVMVEAIVIRKRDVVFPIRGSHAAVKNSKWVDAENSDPVSFFFPGEQTDACVMFVAGTRVNAVLSQRAECDTYPPTGICAFDLPLRVVDSDTWAEYGE